MSGRRLRGEVRPPGDKSISHRALILGAMAEGATLIEGLSKGADVGSTWHCLRELGVQITSAGDRTTVKGRGWRGLAEPMHHLEAGNSGTTMRLLMGVVAGNPVVGIFEGDDSLRRRPMARVAEPLRRMGATIELSPAGTAPVTVRGAALAGIDHVSPVASAQVKSAVLLAGLLATGETSVTEPVLSRDHTERLLPSFGITPRREGLKVTVTGGLRLARAHLRVPGDVSSAAFWLVGALLAPGSEVKVARVGINPTRAGLLEVLKRMGAKISVEKDQSGEFGAEPVADLVVSSAELSAAEIEPFEVPSLIDEIPILALAASQARGTSRFRGLAELRHKESDRLQAVAGLLNRLGGSASVEGDDLIVAGPKPLHGAKLDAGGDHRIAMTAMIAGLCARGPVEVTDARCADISYPSFTTDLARLDGR